MKRLEPILFRFVFLAAACGFLFCVAGFFANHESEQKLYFVILACVGPASVMVFFYAVCWAFTGRLKPWIPN